MFDTRSGFWLMASIAITALLATGAVILLAPDSELTYDTFAAAIGFPMAVILPMIAILVGHQRVEPAQRADDVHAGPAPRPGDRGQGWSAPCSIGVVSMLRRLRASAPSATSLGTAITGDRPGVGHLAQPTRLTSCWPTCWAC